MPEAGGESAGAGSRGPNTNPEVSSAPTNSAADSSAVLGPDAVISIFRAKNEGGVRDGLVADLADRHGITQRAIRDIWNLRTWADTTRPFWTLADRERWERSQSSI
jgi:hypothetical protein